MCLRVIRTATNLVRVLCGMIFCLICGGPVCLAVGFVLLFSRDERADKVHEYNRDVKAYDEKAKGSIELLTPAFINEAEAVPADVDVVAVGYANGIDPAKSERVTAIAAFSRSITYELNRTAPFIRENVTEYETLYATAFCNNGYGCSATAMNNWCVIQYGSGATFIPKGGASSSSLAVACPDRGNCGQCQYTAYLSEYCVVLEHMAPKAVSSDTLGAADVREGEKEGKEATGNGSDLATFIDVLIANSSERVTNDTNSNPGRLSLGSKTISSFETAAAEQSGNASTTATPVDASDTIMTDIPTTTTSTTCPEGEELGVGEEAGGTRNNTLPEEEILFRPSVRFDSCFYPFSPSTQRYSSIRPLYVLFPVLLDTDPFIAMQRITEGTMNFGLDRATQRTAGVALVILGAVTLAVSMLLALILYRCYRNKRAREKYNETRAHRDQLHQYAAAEEGEATGEVREPPHFPKFFGQRLLVGQGSWTATGHRGSIVSGVNLPRQRNGAYRSGSEESFSSFSSQTSSPTPTNAPVATGISEALGMGEVKQIFNVGVADRRRRRQQEETRKRRQRRGSNGYNQSSQHPSDAQNYITYSALAESEEEENNPSFEYYDGNLYYDGRANGSRIRQRDGDSERGEAFASFGTVPIDSSSFQPSVSPTVIDENNDRGHPSNKDGSRNNRHQNQNWDREEVMRSRGGGGERAVPQQHDPKDESLPTLRSCHSSSAPPSSADESLNLEKCRGK